MPKAVIIGGASWNTMIHVAALPEPRSQTVFPLRSHQAVGSSGAGKALNLAALGWDVTLVAGIGTDDAGGRARAELAAGGVTLHSPPTEQPTMHHVNLMDPRGERVSIFLTPQPNEPVDLEALVALAAASDVDLVAVGIFDQYRTTLQPLRNVGVRLWVDIHDYDGHADYHRDFIDAATCLQLSTVTLRDWRAFAERRLADGPTEIVVCTHGRDGASILTAEGWTEVEPVPPAELVDANGAGDAFMAGFADGLHRRLDIAGAGRCAAATAALALASPGLAPRPAT